MPDTSLNTSKFTLAERFRPNEDFARFTRQIAEYQLRFQRLAEPALRQAAAFAQIMRQPLPEPEQRQVAALTRLYRDAQQPIPEWLRQLGRLVDEIQRSESFKRFSMTAAHLNRQLTSGVSGQPTAQEKPPFKDSADLMYLDHVEQARKRYGRWPTWKEDDTVWRVANGISRERLRKLRRDHRPAEIKKRGRLPSKQAFNPPITQKEIGENWRTLTAEIGGRKI